MQSVKVDIYIVELPKIYGATMNYYAADRF